MPLITAAIDPVTRIEGHLKIEVEIDRVDGAFQIVDARSIGTLFRGFEPILQGRDPRDAPIITSRICGVCPTAHSMASVQALDAAFNATPTQAGAILRDLVHAACFLESHVLHFFLLSLPDFIQGPGIPPWQPSWELDNRFPKTEQDRLLGDYLQAIAIRRKTHEMAAIYGGKLPHTPAFIPGGFTARPTADSISQFQQLLTEITEFIESRYIPATELLASYYPDYTHIGSGFGHFLSFGVFQPRQVAGPALIPSGVYKKGAASPEPLDPSKISEDVTCGWYRNQPQPLHPEQGQTEPQYPKDTGYSWLKAPRYDGLPMECGPLARMAIAQEYPAQASVIDRHKARAHEALLLARAMGEWLQQLPENSAPNSTFNLPEQSAGVGLTEAPRGALGHWLKINDGLIEHYQVITPTCWNCSPKDQAGLYGPLEQALIGTPVKNPDQPLEALRIIHSVDPCLDCATHVMRPGQPSTIQIRL